MQEKTTSEINFELWYLISSVRHSIYLAREKELNPYDISTRPAYILRIIQELDSKATISAIAKRVQREIPVISRQTARMEKDGLIKRIKTRPNSNYLQLELTPKGIELIKVSNQSKLLDEIFSFLSKEDHQRLRAIFNKMLKNLDRYNSG